MRVRHVGSGLLALGMISVTGCGDRERRSDFEPVARYIDETPPAELRTPEQVAEVLGASNPERVMFLGTSWPVILDTDARSFDPSCPRFIDQSDRAAEIVDWRIEGGCTAMSERGAMVRVEGRIVATGDADGTVIRYEDFTTVELEDCDGTSVEVGLAAAGEVRVPYAFLLDPDEKEPGAPRDREPPMDGYGYPSGHYVVSILFESMESDEACERVTYGLAYDVRMDYMDEDQDGASSRDVVQMEGRAARRSSAGLMDGPAPVGSWELSATGYTMASNVCASEPLAGTMTVKAGGNEATVRPDGATSCAAVDEPPCAPWSLDGQDQPEQICEYTGCSAGPDAPPPWIALAILLAGLLRQRRGARARARG